MNQEEFKSGFDQLVKAFTVQKAEEKSLIYFEKLNRLSESTFLKTCNFVIENEDKFPSIMKLIQISRNFPDQHHKTQHECKDCDSTGMISKWRHGFRCRCLNGEQMSKRIPLVPVTQEEKKTWYGRLNKEWNTTYGKDLVEGHSYQGSGLDPIVEKAKELFGIL